MNKELEPYRLMLKGAISELDSDSQRLIYSELEYLVEQVEQVNDDIKPFVFGLLGLELAEKDYEPLLS